MTHLDRERISPQRTLDALAVERTRCSAIEARRAREQATKARGAGSRGAEPTALVTSIDERRDLSAQWTASSKRLAPADIGERARRKRLALPSALSGALRGRCAMVAAIRQPSSRFGTAIVRNGVEVGVPRAAVGSSTRVVAFRAVHSYGNLSSSSTASGRSRSAT
jgi:hypothetical protein